MFSNVLQLSNGSLGRALKREADESFSEKRGKKSPANKKSEVDVDLVREHISSYPQYISHYCRKDNQHVKYLPQTLNLALMHRMYSADCSQRKVKPVSRPPSRRISRRPGKKCGLAAGKIAASRQQSRRNAQNARLNVALPRNVN